MKNRANIPLMLLLFGVIFCGSCTNLKPVSTFSGEAVTGLEKYEGIRSGFASSCEGDCLEKNIRDLTVNPGPCDCSPDQRADSINRVIYSAALGYFQVLVLLADDQKTRVHTAGLTGALTAGNFGPVTLNSEQADAFSGISSALMNRITDRYRKKNLKKYVGQAEGYLPVLLEFLDLNLAGNLYQKLEVRKRRWKDFYFDLSMDPGLTTYERTKFVEDYYRHLRELSARQEQINLYSEIIRLIREGHAKLAKLIENPREPGLREELIQAGSELHGTILHFNSAGIWDN